MDHDGLARAQRLDDLIGELGHCLPRSRNTAIGYWKGAKRKSTGCRRSGFAREVEVRLLIGLQKRDDDIDPCVTPGSDLIIEPLCAAGSGDDS